jgi:acetyl esterase/lipase
MTKYAFDPEFEELIPLLPVTTMDFGDVEAIKAARDPALFLELMGNRPDRDDVSYDDHMIPGAEGDPEVRVRVYTPKVESSEARPALVYIHGGGFMVGSIEMMDSACQTYCAELGAVIVSVGYRLAPEDPFPAGLEDCYAGLVWTAANAGELGIDPARIGVGGGSAGGGLSAATALLARDRGGPSLCFQFLQIPEVDDRLHTPSMQQFTDTPMWNRPNAEWSWKHYLGPLHGSDDIPYLAAPARCEDLSGLPPAYVSTMEFDPLRDEGILYALGLMQAGVPVELHSFPGTFHGSAMIAHAAVSQRNAAEEMLALKRGLGVPTT